MYDDSQERRRFGTNGRPTDAAAPTTPAVSSAFRPRYRSTLLVHPLLRRMESLYPGFISYARGYTLKMLTLYPDDCVLEYVAEKRTLCAQ